MLKISGLTPLGGCWEYADSTKMTGLRHFGLVEDFATGFLIPSRNEGDKFNFIFLCVFAPLREPLFPGTTDGHVKDLPANAPGWLLGICGFYQDDRATSLWVGRRLCYRYF
ncbi:hypothetical protein [Lunatimonas salinarum]|uniref:hypothetical protein n=1 Tax=Lunatimonas salinarum TaxID=1774590 RepID=UPI001AE0D0BA|nr:hypothetical protein [Lunatimonas salinarum]